MVDFLIVGTARSGTTLVQRLACELPDVYVPPETRFFEAFVQRRLHRIKFPLIGDALRRQVVAYSRLRSSQGLNLDVNSVMNRLKGRCDNYPQLFDALVATLAHADEGAIIGEKTPIHLQWWRPIAQAMPNVRIVAVVRDPRSVVASCLHVWRRSHVWVAVRWHSDQTLLTEAQTMLGQRLLLLRYEDVVSDPVKAQEELRLFLGAHNRGPVRTRPVSPEMITVSSEWWKSQVFEPVTPARTAVWQDTLTPKQADEVLAICSRTAPRFGYPPPERGVRQAFIGLGPMSIPELGLARVIHSLDRRRKANTRFDGGLTAGRHMT